MAKGILIDQEICIGRLNQTLRFSQKALSMVKIALMREYIYYFLYLRNGYKKDLHICSKMPLKL